jgi:hypothetical protein
MPTGSGSDREPRHYRLFLGPRREIFCKPTRACLGGVIPSAPPYAVLTCSVLYDWPRLAAALTIMSGSTGARLK